MGSPSNLPTASKSRVARLGSTADRAVNWVVGVALNGALVVVIAGGALCLAASIGIGVVREAWDEFRGTP